MPMIQTAIRYVVGGL